ncbi:hypothetical protein [Streptococcus infantis]|jgi:lipoprotein|uniref:hypothetical protein n=1 Tax=Streptococcus infantis TaxID=68892 RepID=UPI002067E87C|nr:MAG TPA: protein of unknown function (DUF4969) [Caudoviricetes sp.]
MKKVMLLATTLLAATFLIACNETSTKTNEVSKVSSTRELEKSEGKAKIQPAKDFKNTPIGEYKLADNDFYGAWPDNTKMVIDDSVVQVVDPSTVFTKYLIYLNGKESNPVVLKIFVEDREGFDVTKVSKFYVRANGTQTYKGKEIPLFLVDGFEY